MNSVHGYRGGPLSLAGAPVIDLSQPMRRGMPQSPNHPPFRMLLERRHGDHVRADGGSAANELIVTGGHVGTHVDALAHVSQAGLLHGDVPAASVQSHEGFSRHGIEEFPPYVGRAVFLDVAAVHGVPVLPAGYEITVADLEKARDAAGVDIEAGEALLLGTGWSRHWADARVFTGQEGGAPGPGPAAGAWIAERGVRVTGGETIAFEHVPPRRGHAELPVHRLLLVEAGIHIVETMRLTGLTEPAGLASRRRADFLLMLAPLPVVGATGSPVRPLAILHDHDREGRA
ncbi:cyclase family protein [Streptomyces sp. H27-S2]|uniref:cyclase family protein n=1 Tax=Streptomyces antarcticus TaxID=2996458 RepID=UPI0022709360|nr:cyclase family protein [Streptomyces sp. H27-S2]MCY0949140.1 cyclase family protein [Streptomyces sp. H27-S2]